MRERWLPGISLRERTVTPGRGARFDWPDGIRLTVTFTASGPAKGQVAVSHEQLPNAAAAENARSSWRERLTALKTVLEHDLPRA